MPAGLASVTQTQWRRYTRHANTSSLQCKCLCWSPIHTVEHSGWGVAAFTLGNCLEQMVILRNEAAFMSVDNCLQHVHLLLHACRQVHEQVIIFCSAAGLGMMV